MTFLDQILKDAADELSSAKAKRPLSEIKRMAADLAAPLSLPDSLAGSFCLIAEVKQRSPSVGPMREKNVADALRAYEESPVVRGISVLTNQLHFGQGIEHLTAARQLVTKPLLRKDFIVDEYQVREARAFGADAILLMANVLDAPRLAGFYNLARELGMQALFEVHTEEEIAMLPPDPRLVGINSRKFKSDAGFVGTTGASEKDFSLDYTAFSLADKLPASALKVAESGISPDRIPNLREKFDAGLVGTSLLRDERGLRPCLAEFEEAIFAGE